MKKQLATLQQLLAVMDPVLYRHLGTLDYLLTGGPVNDVALPDPGLLQRKLTA